MTTTAKAGRVARLSGAIGCVAAMLLVADALGAFEAQQLLTAGDGAAFDQFGLAVAIDGNTAVVGADADDGSRGAVYVFTRSGDTWSQTAKLTASDAAPGDQLGNRVAIDGDVIVAGAPFDTVGANAEQGSAYTFALTGAAAGTETAKLTASDGAMGDRLGSAVAIDGDTIVVGAPSNDAQRGSAYTFASTGAASRTQTAKLTASDAAPGDNLGASAAIDGDTIVAGAPYDDSAKGSAYTFARTGAAARTQSAKLTASDGSAGDILGFSVAIEGDTIVAGAPDDKVGAFAGQGSAYTFARTGASARTETAKLSASDGQGGDHLGNSVAISSALIVAGAPEDDVGSNLDQGSTYTFSRTGGGARNEIGHLTAADGAATDEMGTAVAISGDALLVGAEFDDIGLNEVGSASVFFTPTPAPPPDDGNPPPADATAPNLTLSGKKIQKLDAAVEVRAVADESSTVTGSGRLRVNAPAGDGGRAAARSRSFKLASASLELSAGQRGTLHVRVPKRARRAAAKALSAGGKVIAVIAVTATDASSNATSAKRRVTLKLARRP